MHPLTPPPSLSRSARAQKAEFAFKHFEGDTNLSFALLEEDPVTKRPVSKAGAAVGGSDKAVPKAVRAPGVFVRPATSRWRVPASSPAANARGWYLSPPACRPPACPPPPPPPPFPQVRRLISNPTVKKDFGALLGGQSPDRRKLAQLIDLLERMMQVLRGARLQGGQVHVAVGRLPATVGSGLEQAHLHSHPWLEMCTTPWQAPCTCQPFCLPAPLLCSWIPTSASPPRRR